MSNLDDFLESINRIRPVRDEEMKFFKFNKQSNDLYTVIAYNKDKQLIWRAYNTPEEEINEYKKRYSILK